MVLMCHSLFLLEDVAGVPLLLDLLQLGKALAPVARCPVTGERSGLRKSIGIVRRVKAFIIVNVVNIVTEARERVCMSPRRATWKVGIFRIGWLHP